MCESDPCLALFRPFITYQWQAEDCYSEKDLDRGSLVLSSSARETFMLLGSFKEHNKASHHTTGEEHNEQ